MMEYRYDPSLHYGVQALRKTHSVIGKNFLIKATWNRKQLVFYTLYSQFLSIACDGLSLYFPCNLLILFFIVHNTLIHIYILIFMNEEY